MDGLFLQLFLEIDSLNIGLKLVEKFNTFLLTSLFYAYAGKTVLHILIQSLEKHKVFQNHAPLAHLPHNLKSY